MNLAEPDLDDLVISQADDEAAWDKSIRVNRERLFSLSFGPSSEITSEKEILSGEPVFRGTQVPISALLDDLEKGVSLDDFLKNFPTVKREQALLTFWNYSGIHSRN